MAPGRKLGNGWDPKLLDRRQRNGRGKMEKRLVRVVLIGKDML